ncbi:MAG TPA: hypothetical protein VJT49_09940 [Amycolatopsis sp.]|uniref:hypothetical protein n=1 Tax=Amycolatopsis sp. TaxID=37632 RepID=UPI002B4599C3|nr:hypothetical protein [Amycolatopsis sp.]HKS45418.1 hypothetical protein [Amycolatopsis sp.]
MRRFLAALVAALGLTVVAAPMASAYEPVNMVHTERVQAGPYGLTVGFSVWPLRAQQSLDFTFIPDGGIDGKSGTLTTVNPVTCTSRPQPLARHPRKRDVWGLDVRALRVEGDWTFRFQLAGPLGQGTGELRGLTVLAQPGPPMALSWSISILPLIALVAFLVAAWRRTRAQVAGTVPAT